MSWVSGGHCWSCASWSADPAATVICVTSCLVSQQICSLSDSRSYKTLGLVDRADLPAPIGRTVYTLSDMGWQRVLPVLQTIAWFGLDRLDPIDGGPVSALNGFLAGILLGFNPVGAAGLDATYRIEIDGRRFEFAVTQGHLAGAHGEPLVTVTARAADLVAARLGAGEAKRKAALRRINFDGDQRDVDALRTAFSLSA